MVNYSSRVLDSTFSALADPTRRAILARLARGECSVTQLADPFDVSLPAISKHLRVLENAGLLCREKTGRVHRCCLAADPLKHASEWIAAYRRFWEKRLDALARYLDESQRKEEAAWLAKPHHSHQNPSSRLNGRSQPRGKKSSGPGRTRKS